MRAHFYYLNGRQRTKLDSGTELLYLSLNRKYLFTKWTPSPFLCRSIAFALEMTHLFSIDKRNLVAIIKN